MSQTLKPRPSRRRRALLLTGLLLLLIVAYPASSGPASFALARGWIHGGDYRAMYGLLDRAVSGTPLAGTYYWYHTRWFDMGYPSSQRPQRTSYPLWGRVDRSDPFGLPPVASVSMPVDPPEPRLTIVHIADWHFVPYHVFAADERFHDPAVGEEQLEQRYEAFLAEVEAVQAEQRAVLEHLIEHHGLKVVYLERLTDGLLEAYLDRAKGILAVDADSLFARLEQLERDGDPTEYAFARLAFEQHRQDRLDTGAAGMLLAEGKLAELRAAEDATDHAAANPVQEDGSIVWDESAQASREHAIVERLLDADEPLVAIILGGRHDLSDELAGREAVQLVRVEVSAWRRAVSGLGP